jgi:hypothetical protein
MLAYTRRPDARSRTVRDTREDPENGGLLRTPGADCSTRWRGMNVLPSVIAQCADSATLVNHSSLTANYY